MPSPGFPARVKQRVPGCSRVPGFWQRVTPLLLCEIIKIARQNIRDGFPGVFLYELLPRGVISGMTGCHSWGLQGEIAGTRAPDTLILASTQGPSTRRGLGATRTRDEHWRDGYYSQVSGFFGRWGTPLHNRPIQPGQSAKHGILRLNTCISHRVGYEF